MRRLPALLTTAALAAVLASSLTSCSLLPSGLVPGACERPFTSGDASSAVDVSKSTSSKPVVDFPTPLIVHDPQVSTVVEGEGDPIREGDTIDIEYSLFDGATGELLTASGYEDGPGTRLTAGGSLTEGGEATSISRAFECATLGERFVLVTTAGDAYGADVPQGFTDDTTIVLVADIEAHYLGKADGVNQLPQDGMPTVVTAPDGTPGIQVPATDPPTDTRVATIKAGGGPAVEDGDVIIAHWSGWIWPAAGDDVFQFDTTWDFTPQSIIIPGTGETNEGIPPGARQPLIGTTVGSQLLVVMPAEDAYPNGLPTSVPAGSTIIVVIDVLGIQK